MNHLSAETLNLYLDDELEPAVRAAATAHLAACAVCRRELAALESVFQALDHLSPERLPLDLTEPVLARLAPEPWWRRSALAGVVLGGQVIASALLALWLAPPLAGLPAVALAPLAEVAVLMPSLVGAGWPAGPLPTPEALVPLDAGALASLLTPAQWAATVALAGLGCLVANRLLLAPPATAEEGR